MIAAARVVEEIVDDLVNDDGDLSEEEWVESRKWLPRRVARRTKEGGEEVIGVVPTPVSALERIAGLVRE